MTNNKIRSAYRTLFAYGLQGWKIEWSVPDDDPLDATLGETDHESKIIFLDPEVQAWKQVLLHEIAHALLGPDHGHDQVWKDKALQIGCRPDYVSAFVGDDGDE